MSNNYNYKPKKICNKCKKEIPHLISMGCGKRFKCPLCLQIVDFHKCIIMNPTIFPMRKEHVTTSEAITTVQKTK